MWLVFLGVFVFIVVILWIGSSKNRSHHIPRVRKVWPSLLKQQSEDEDTIRHREMKTKRWSAHR